MPEYYLSHQKRLIAAEVPSDDPPAEMPAPLEAEEWVSGWLITAPANPLQAREIMGGLAQVVGRLPEDTLLLYPYDEASVADVIVNWLEALETDPDMPALLEEEVEANAEGFRNLVLGEETLWRGMKEILGFLPQGKAAIQPIEAYQALLEEALSEFHDAARKGLDVLSPQVVHELGKKARLLLTRDKREALIKVVRSLAPA